METLRNRLELLEKYRNRRTDNIKNNRVNDSLIFVFTVGLILSSWFFFYTLGYQTSGHTVTPHTMGAALKGKLPDTTGDTVHVDNYRFHFIPENDSSMNGLWGYTYGTNSRDIYINKAAPPEQVYETCVHEKLHTLGVGVERHTWIESSDDRIRDSTCSKLLYLIPPGTLE